MGGSIKIVQDAGTFIRAELQMSGQRIDARSSGLNFFFEKRAVSQRSEETLMRHLECSRT